MMLLQSLIGDSEYRKLWEYEMYKETNKEAKQVASDAKFKAYNGLYNRERKKHSFKFEKK